MAALNMSLFQIGHRRWLPTQTFLPLLEEINYHPPLSHFNNLKYVIITNHLIKSIRGNYGTFET